MTILFNKTLEQCRQLGARGGRAHDRNLRPSQAQHAPVAPLPELLSETAHQASLRLDAQFPWLAAAFTRRPDRGGKKSKKHTLIDSKGSLCLLTEGL